MEPGCQHHRLDVCLPASIREGIQSGAFSEKGRHGRPGCAEQKQGGRSPEGLLLCLRAVQALQQGRRQRLSGTICLVRVQRVTPMIWKNGSGCWDPTAGEALSRIIREEKNRRRGQNMNGRDQHRTISGTGQRRRGSGGQGLSVHTPSAEVSPGGRQDKAGNEGA